MKSHGSGRRRMSMAMLVVCVCVVHSSASAQTSGQDAIAPDHTALENVLTSGATVWVTDTAGREEKGRIVDFSGGVVTLSDGDAVRRMRTEEVRRVRMRRMDPLWNGAAIGAAAAIATGLYMCHLMEPWDVCLNAGPIVRIGAVGAGIGAGVDALIRGRKTVYEAPPRATFQVAPILDARTHGIAARISF